MTDRFCACSYCKRYFIQDGIDITYDVMIGCNLIRLYFCSSECESKNIRKRIDMIKYKNGIEMMNSNAMRTALYGNERYSTRGYNHNTWTGTNEFIVSKTARSLTELFTLNTKEEFNEYLKLLISENLMS